MDVVAVAELRTDADHASSVVDHSDWEELAFQKASEIPEACLKGVDLVGDEHQTSYYVDSEERKDCEVRFGSWGAYHGEEGDWDGLGDRGPYVGTWVDDVKR